MVMTACGDNRAPQLEPDATPPPSPDPGVPLEREHSGGSPSVIVVANGRVFVGLGPRLVIRGFDGTLIGESAPLRGLITAIAVVGDRAFVAERVDLDAKLHVLDISDPVAIVETKLLDFAPPGGFSVIRDLEPAGSTLYVADQEQGVFELDITNPDEPAVVQTAPIFGVTDLQLNGPRLYFWSGDFGGVSIGLLDTTRNLELFGEGSLGFHASVAVTGTNAITAGPDGIFVYSLADITAPVEKFHVGAFDSGPFARAVAASGQTAWVPAIDGLYVLDLTGGTVVLSGPIDVPTVAANAAAVADGTLAVATDRGRMLTFDVSSPLAPSAPTVTDITICTNCTDLEATAETVVLADQLGGVRPARLTNLDTLGRSPPTEVQPGLNGLTFVFEGVAVAGTRAYVADWLSGLRIYDVADPAAIVELGSRRTGGFPAHVAIVKDRLYVAESTNAGGLKIFDIADPANPEQLGAIASEKAMKVRVRNNIAFVADQPAGLLSIDVSDPTKPTLLGKYETECLFPRDVALVPDHELAVVACDFDGFHIVDISNPAQPSRVTVIPAPPVSSASAVATYAGHAVLGHSSGVIVVSLANPAAPMQIAAHPTATLVRALDVPLPGRVVAATGYGGVYQWQIE